MRGMGTVDNIQRPQGAGIKRVGVRLFHESLRNCVYVVVHPTKGYKHPYLCPTCNKQHERKSIHLNLDSEGSVIVSSGVLEDLRQAGMPGLTIANEVTNPPMQTLFMGSQAHAFEIQEVDVGGKKLKVVKRKLFRRKDG